MSHKVSPISKSKYDFIPMDTTSRDMIEKLSLRIIKLEDSKDLERAVLRHHIINQRNTMAAQNTFLSETLSSQSKLLSESHMSHSAFVLECSSNVHLLRSAQTSLLTFLEKQKDAIEKMELNLLKLHHTVLEMEQTIQM